MSFLAAVITENGALFYNDHSYSVRTQNTPRAFPKGELLRRAPSTLDELSVWSAQSFRKVVDVYFSRQVNFDVRKCEQNHEFPTVREKKNSSKCRKSVLFWLVLPFLGSSCGQVPAQNRVNVPMKEPLWIVLDKDWPEFPQIYPGIPSLCKIFMSIYDFQS